MNSSLIGNLTGTYSEKPRLKIEMPIDVILYGTLTYISIFIIGVCGNLLVIYVLMKEKELRNFTNYLLANLSLADLMVLFTCIPTGLHDLFAKERWYLGQMWCYLVAFTENCMSFASILTIFFITCERYYVICRPLRVRSFMTQSRTLKLVIVIWIISVLANLPLIFWSNYKTSRFYDGTIGYKCYTKLDNKLSFYYTLSSNLFIYFFIGILLMAMYCKIYKYLNQSNEFLLSCSNKPHNSNTLTNSVHSTTAHHHNQNRALVNNNNNNHKKHHRLSSIFSSNSFKFDCRSSLNNRNFQIHLNELSKNFNLNPKKSILHMRGLNGGANLVFLKRDLNNEETIIINNINNELTKYVKQRKKIVAMLVTLIAVFYVCLFPLKIWNLILLLFSSKPYFTKTINLKLYWYINVTCRILFYLNSSINPILYNWFSKKFRRNFRKFVYIPKFLMKNSSV